MTSSPCLFTTPCAPATMLESFFKSMHSGTKPHSCAELHKKVEENARLWGNVSVSLQAAKASAMAVGLSSMAAAEGATHPARKRRSPAQHAMPQVSQDVAGDSDGVGSASGESGAEPVYVPPMRKGPLSKLRTARKPASRKRAAAYEEHTPLDQPCLVDSAMAESRCFSTLSDGPCMKLIATSYALHVCRSQQLACLRPRNARR